MSPQPSAGVSVPGWPRHRCGQLRTACKLELGALAETLVLAVPVAGVVLVPDAQCSWLEERLCALLRKKGGKHWAGLPGRLQGAGPGHCSLEVTPSGVCVRPCGCSERSPVSPRPALPWLSSPHHACMSAVLEGPPRPVLAADPGVW